MRCSSFCIADGFRHDDLMRHLRMNGYDPKTHDGVVYARVSEEESKTIQEVFIFPYGSVNTWGLDLQDARKILDLVRPFQVLPLSRVIEDHFTYLIGKETLIREENDEIILERDDPLIKLSLSHGLSQSVKLAAFEASIDRTIEKTKHIPKEFAEKGKVSLSRKRLSQQLGALFAERNSINLHSDILDTPEFFWRRPKYEPYYLMAYDYMDIDARMDILNKRLDVIRDLYEMLSNELNHIHSSRLEWTIICLIVIEVVLVLMKDFFKLI